MIDSMPPPGKQAQHAEAGGDEREGVRSSGPAVKLMSDRVCVCAKLITLPGYRKPEQIQAWRDRLRVACEWRA
jgi:hypothetical protein